MLELIIDGNPQGVPYDGQLIDVGNAEDVAFLDLETNTILAIGKLPASVSQGQMIMSPSRQLVVRYEFPIGVEPTQPDGDPDPPAQDDE